MAAARKDRDLAAEIAFLTRALKAPTLRESVGRLAERARADSWSHEEFLVACLQREVSARESHGGEGRIRAARFPARKSLEEFDFDHARALKRDLIAHLGTLDFVTGRENVFFLGPRHRQDPPRHRPGDPHHEARLQAELARLGRHPLIVLLRRTAASRARPAHRPRPGHPAQAIRQADHHLPDR